MEQIKDGRPFLVYGARPRPMFPTAEGNLPEHFDDEYFRYMQWAHLASGGAGGGFRWPYRHPHSLTMGMRQPQKVLAAFAKSIDWKNFLRKNRSSLLGDTPQAVAGLCMRR